MFVDVGGDIFFRLILVVMFEIEGVIGMIDGNFVYSWLCKRIGRVV